MAIFIIALGFLSPFISFCSFSDGFNWSDRITSYGKLGPVSDWISGVTIPFFTFASFIVLCLAYQSQRKELEEARKQMAKQSEIMSLQKFEDTFIHLLRLFSEYRNEGNLNNDFNDIVNNYISVKYPKLPGQTRDSVRERYVERRSNYNLAVYNKLLKQILIFIIDNKSVDDKKKRQYFGIIETTMTLRELDILAWDCYFGYYNESIVEAVKKSILTGGQLENCESVIQRIVLDEV